MMKNYLQPNEIRKMSNEDKERAKESIARWADYGTWAKVCNCPFAFTRSFYPCKDFCNKIFKYNVIEINDVDGGIELETNECPCHRYSVDMVSKMIPYMMEILEEKK